MAKQKTEAGQQVRAAEQAFNDAAAIAKRLKAKSREAKRKVKQAKKAAKKASKDARAARKASEKARRAYRRALARAAKERKKTAKENESIVTPKRRSPRSDAHVQSRRKASRRRRARDWDVGEDAVDSSRTTAATARVETPGVA